MKVYTYYTPVPELYSEDTQRLLIDVWARSWKKQGWDPVVLSESDAQRHPRYPEFKKRFWELPTEYGHTYEGACFLRWVAMAAVGGGMMTDYDVINYSFAPREVDPSRMIVFCEKPPGPIFLGMVLAPQALYEGMCQNFFSWQVSQADWNPNARPPQYHCSDLSILLQLFQQPPDKKIAWLTREEGCSIYTHPLWEYAPAVHYGYEMHGLGQWPKYAWIEKIRPF